MLVIAVMLISPWPNWRSRNTAAISQTTPAVDAIARQATVRPTQTASVKRLRSKRSIWRPDQGSTSALSRVPAM